MMNNVTAKCFYLPCRVILYEQTVIIHRYQFLDLADIKAGWKALPSWPGAPRGYAVSAGQSDGFDKCFYLFSGRNYHDDVVDVLTDGYAYNPRLKTWKKLKGYFPVMAGAAMALGVGIGAIVSFLTIQRHLRVQRGRNR